MKIGFDITELYVAQAGVFYYRYNLLRALLQLTPPEHEFHLLDYYPIHGGWLERPEVAALTASHATAHQVTGLRHRKLSRLWFLQKPGLEPAARWVDSVLLAPYGRLARRVMADRLTQQLQGMDVFHTSDVLNFAPPGVKTVTTIHDMTTRLFPEHHTAETIALQEEKFRFAREEADAIIAVSESTKRDAVRLLGLDPARVQVVYEGADPMFRPLPPEVVRAELARYGLEPGGYLLHVGTVEPRKNLVRLVQAYGAVWEKRPLSTPPLVLAGATGWFFREVFEEIERLGLKEQMKFIGRVADVDLPALYNGALFLAYPSLYEGFGLPALEAMACGTAVLTSNVSSLPEVVEDAAILVDPTEVESIANGLQTLLDNTTLREQLERAGHQQAAQFSWKKAARSTLAVYQNVSSSNF